MKNVLIVAAGDGLGDDEAARIQRAVAEALFGAGGEPRVYAATMDAPLEGEEDFQRVMQLARDAVWKSLGQGPHS
jgi:hypothetical protein